MLNYSKVQPCRAESLRIQRVRNQR